MAQSFPSQSYLAAELRVLQEQGFDIAAPERELAAAAGLPEADAARARQTILASLSELPKRRGFAFEEPSELEAIRAARPEGPRRMPLRADERARFDRTFGAWVGRCAGCLLGRPCEGWPRGRIEHVLRSLHAWPLSAYWPAVQDTSELPTDTRWIWRRPDTWSDPPGTVSYPGPDSPELRPNITQMVRDDDLDYPILGLHLLERHGPDFTTADVAWGWLLRLPYYCTYGAERQAYKNLINGLEPPETARYGNTEREYIGAQIRADVWGLAAPGWPEMAAEFAWRDACLSHVKNGIYGEMFFAALLSTALIESDLNKLIEIGLSEVPRGTRFEQAVLKVVEWCEGDADWSETRDRIEREYGHYSPVHVIPNAAVVLMALLHARGDFERAITIAVMSGWDTDCNGATAGSVMGAVLGRKALPAKWADPLNDTVMSYVRDYPVNHISELARRTIAVQQQVLSQSKQ